MAAHRYWQLYMTATGYNAYSFAETQFRTTRGVPLLFSGGTPSASTTYSSPTNDPVQATDNDPTTWWNSAVISGNPPQWWQYDYGPGNALDIQEVSITARNDSAYSQAPTVFTLQWSDDGVTWTSTATCNMTWTYAGQVQLFPIIPYRPPVPSGTVLLMHFDGSSGSSTFTDSSAYPHALTATGGAVVNTASPKFGAGCGDFTGSTSAVINTNNVADFLFGAGQFTVEAWAYYTAVPTATANGLISQWAAVGGAGGQQSWFLGMVGGSFNFQYSSNGSDNPFVGAAYTPPLNTWIHFAADRDASNVLRVYINGAVTAAQTVTTAFFTSSAPCFVGGAQGLAWSHPGYLDEVRVTVGKAVYAGAFTPPTFPFTTPTPAFADGVSSVQGASPYAVGQRSDVLPAARAGLVSAIVADTSRKGAFAVVGVGTVATAGIISAKGFSAGIASATATRTVMASEVGNADGTASVLGISPHTVSSVGHADGAASLFAAAADHVGHADGTSTATGGEVIQGGSAALVMGI